MLMQLKPIALLACSALAAAAAANIRTLKPEIGKLFAVYPGWSLVDAIEVRHKYPIFSLSPFNRYSECCIQCNGAGVSAGLQHRSPGDAGPFCILKSSINVADFTIQSGIVTSVGLIGGCGTWTDTLPIGHCPTCVVGS
ncbi:hypothetical protein DFH08DRAFT_799943 [Mycena albidolilacea]|uniref:Secreted protein n=1 Tax=Mycena albidolilacea TaxID=1033008 RepID=A0AAD7F2I8_9AGAR|nr:hypothetical protein DFH08DRAFT_799943 [Mycena albidolilacea]